MKLLNEVETVTQKGLNRVVNLRRGCEIYLTNANLDSNDLPG